MAINDVNKIRILQEINQLQLSWSPEVFQKASKLLQSKWTEEGFTVFVHYMEGQWFEANCNWYEGVAIRCPSTNNALESFNNEIKREATLRKRFPLRRFLTILEKNIQIWSARMDFSKTPIISQKIWLSAYRFAKADIPMEETRQAHNKSLIYCTAHGQKYTKREMGLFLKHTWKSFDRFTESLKIHCINFINNQDWISSTCTCRYFQKRFISSTFWESQL